MLISQEFLLCFWILLANISKSSGENDNPSSSIFNVMDFGATGNGQEDDTKAFQSAWEAACGSDSSNPTVIVPSEREYLVFPIRFEGPCKSTNVKFEILGTIIAPPKSAWKKKNLEEWLCFHEVNGLTVVGKEQGSINGQGDSWWIKGRDEARPTALRLIQSKNVQVEGLKFINSQKNHLSITYCDSVNIANLHMIAPENSPNTDGINIALSTNIIINNCKMETGDDCIAINGGTSQVTISGVECGPGHGISIGSLGKSSSVDNTVENVHVTNSNFHGTKNGVRIKTWPTDAVGFVRKISFTGINLISVENPIIIDQQYCPHKTCKDKGSKIKISDVRYSEIRGTSTSKNAAIKLSCSKSVPCTNILLNKIDINPASPDFPSVAQCANAYGLVHNSKNPTVDCLMALP